MIDIKRAFTFVLEDEQWFLKMLFGGLSLLIPAVGALVLIGSMLETARNVAFIGGLGMFASVFVGIFTLFYAHLAFGHVLGQMIAQMEHTDNAPASLGGPSGFETPT